MPTSVTMPALGESVTEGTVTRWLKQEGDQVEVDEPLLEVSTDKVDTEIPSPAAGVLTKIVVAEDETVEVGAELAVIGGDAGGDGGAPAQEAPAQQPPAQEAPAQEAPPQEAPAQEAPAEAPAQSGGGDGGGEGTTVTMPALGESVTEGTVTRWLKAVGDEVTADEPLLEVSTDKVDTEIPAPVSGTLLSIAVNEDETVDVGAELAVIGSAGASGGAPSAPAPEPQQQAAPAPEAPAQEAPAPAPQQSQPAPVPATTVTAQPGGDYGLSGDAPTKSPTDRPAPAQAVAPASAPASAPAGDGSGAYVTPLVRRLAAEQGVDLNSVSGTGVGGRIRKQDVIAAAEQAKQAAPAPAAASSAGARTPSPAATPDSALRGRTEKMSRLRTVIAKRMVESLEISAQLTTVVEADVTRIANLRNQVKNDFAAREGVKLSFLPFFA
jgi:pyruvate dehydrogenase E2 component (dihydrolipoamide acetyltransferase)